MRIILFDGVCNLCNGSVKFIMKHHKKDSFNFVSQQSKEGQKLVEKHHLEDYDSIILIDNKEVYLYSDAALEISKEFGDMWKYLYLFRFLPKFFRNGIYKFIAKYRYKIFGKQESCTI